VSSCFAEDLDDFVVDLVILFSQILIIVFNSKHLSIDWSCKIESTERIQKLVEQLKDASSSIKASASEINIISINAAIETAHTSSGVRTMMDKVLDSTMTTICRVLTKLLDTGSFSMEIGDIVQFAKWAGVDEIYITDADGVVVGSNNASAIGWRLPDDPKAQAYEFRSLIGQKDGVVTQTIKARDIDSLMFKFVGVSRIDQPGIVQIGFQAGTIIQYQAEISSVFGILAKEIKTLGTEVTNASKKIMEVTNELQKEN